MYQALSLGQPESLSLPKMLYPSVLGFFFLIFEALEISLSLLSYRSW